MSYTGYQKSEFCLKQDRKISDFCLKQGEEQGRTSPPKDISSTPPPGNNAKELGPACQTIPGNLLLTVKIIGQNPTRRKLWKQTLKVIKPLLKEQIKLFPSRPKFPF